MAPEKRTDTWWIIWHMNFESPNFHGNIGSGSTPFEVWMDEALGQIEGIKMIRERKIVCLCGSMRFEEAFKEANHQETLKGNIVLSVGDFRRHDEISMSDKERKELDQLHFDKIELADEVLILNVSGYIGESTTNELNHAKKLGKKIRFLEAAGGEVKNEQDD